MQLADLGSSNIRKDIFQVQHKFKGSLLDEQYDTNPAAFLAIAMADWLSFIRKVGPFGLLPSSVRSCLI